MMKKIIAILLAILALFSLSSCKKEYFYADGTRDLYSDFSIRAQDITLDMAFEILRTYYPSQDAVIFVPRSGEYKTRKGESFTASVDELCGVYIMENAELSRMTFHVTIYDSDGNLIVEKQAFNSYLEVDTKKLDLTYVSEEFKPYWEVIAVRSDKLE